jgi:glycosyltransferase involved in cell wall biosynthesis
MVATFWKNKDYPSYFKAAGLILEKRQDITFVAIGANTDSPESIGLIGKKYISNFRLLGKQNGVESYINAMDICVLSTFTEGISNAVLEYMALGKPVIVTRGGGTCEIVSEGISGFLIDPLDPDALAGKIEILLSDPKLRTEMGSAGQERIREEFSIDQMVKKYTELYSKLSLK